MSRSILYAKRNLSSPKTFKKLQASKAMYEVISFSSDIDKDVWDFFLTHRVNKGNLIKFTEEFKDHYPYTVESVLNLINNWDLFDSVELHNLV